MKTKANIVTDDPSSYELTMVRQSRYLLGCRRGTLTYTPTLAASLNLLFLQCNAPRRKEEVPAASQKAVHIGRFPVVANYEVISMRADLAKSLSNISLQLDALGRNSAKQSIWESAETRRVWLRRIPINQRETTQRSSSRVSRSL